MTKEEKQLKNRRRDFLKDLEKLTRKYKLHVWGCGCCGSPNVDEVNPNELGEDYHYTLEDDGSSLSWDNE